MVKYLLDTHTAVWLFSDSKKLSSKVRGIFTDRETALAISIASAWEIAIKISKGGSIPGVNGVALFMDKLHENGIEVLNITFEEIKIIESLPLIHRDPFDRAIIATAMSQELTIISVDKNIRKYEVSCIWY